MSFIDYTVADPNAVTPGGYQGTDYYRSELHDTNQYAIIKTATMGHFPGVVANIVMDDARTTKSGTWTLATTMDAGTGGSVYFYGSGGQWTNSFGTNFFYHSLSGSGAYMQFTPNILTAGDYNVYQWHPTTNNASTTVPFVINYNGGSTTINADQTTNGGNWTLLGKFNFAAGTAGYIRVTDSVTDSGKVAMVDGIKLVFVGSVTTLGSSANPAVYGDSVTLTATVAVTGGTATGTVTFKDGANTLGTATLDGSGQATFTTNKLSAAGSPRSLTAVYGGDSNYSGSTSSVLSQTINQKSLTVSGITASDKVYDATTNATLNTSGASLVGVIGLDSVTLSTGSASGAFADKAVGTNKTVTVSGLSLAGGDASNYSLSQPATTASIAARGLTVSGLGANDKVYDGTAAATLTGTPTLVGVQGSDAVSLTGTPVGAFTDPNVGALKTVNISGLGLTGAGAGNYFLTAPTATANITGASTTTGLVSSGTPSGPGTNVTFTATVGSAAGAPAGNVVFLAGGVPFRTNALAGGVAAASTATLPLGTNHIQAAYAGGGNFLASTGSVDQVVKVFITCSQTNALLSIVRNVGGTFTLTFKGTPQAAYYVIASPDLTTSLEGWLPVPGSTNTVTNSSGLWQFTVTNGTSQQFYRGAAVPCP